MFVASMIVLIVHCFRHRPIHESIWTKSVNSNSTFLLTFKDVVKSILYSFRRPLQSHDLLPPLHFKIGKQTLVESCSECFFIKLLANQDKFLSSVAPRLLEVIENAFLCFCAGRPLIWTMLAEVNSGPASLPSSRVQNHCSPP